MNKPEVKDALLVSIVNDILVVGRKEPNQAATVINAFQGEEAIALYKALLGEGNLTHAKIS